MTSVAVIMPVHDSHEWLDEAVDSVLTQSHPDLQLLLVDLASTEWATRAGLSRQKARGVSVLHLDDPDPARGRRRALDDVAGDVVLMLDAADLLGSSYVARTVTALAGTPAADAVIGAGQFIGAARGTLEAPDAPALVASLRGTGPVLPYVLRTDTARHLVATACRDTGTAPDEAGTRTLTVRHLEGARFRHRVRATSVTRPPVRAPHPDHHPLRRGLAGLRSLVSQRP